MRSTYWRRLHEQVPADHNHERGAARPRRGVPRPLDDVWNRSEPYARRKLDLCRERQPEVEYFNNEYLVLLAADTVRETEFSDFTLADYAAKMAARATS